MNQIHAEESSLLLLGDCVKALGPAPEENSAFHCGIQSQKDARFSK